MPALTDNYTTSEHITETKTRLVNVHYLIDIPQPVSSSIVVSFSRAPGINQRALNLLLLYKDLKDNWDEDGGKEPGDSALKKATELTLLLEKHGQKVYHTAPGPNGEIMLDLRNNEKNKSLEIIIYANRAVSVLFPENEKPTQQTFDFDNLPELIQWLNEKN
jgi:hypothetical protein